MDAVARKLNTDAHSLPLHAGEHATVISQQRHDGEYPELRVTLADGSWYDLRLVQFSEPGESSDGFLKQI